jgi:hypothetical protein
VINNLGILYQTQGKLDEAEKMYMQKLQGYREAVEMHTSMHRSILNHSPGDIYNCCWKATALGWAVAKSNLPLGYAKDNQVVYLQYDIGDFVTVQRKDSSGWWFASLANRKSAGWIASDLFIGLQPRYLNKAPLVQLC